MIHFLNKFCYYHILNHYISYYTCVILSIFFFFSYGKKKFSSHNKKYFVDPDRHNEDFVTTNFSSRSHTFVMIRLDCICKFCFDYYSEGIDDLASSFNDQLLSEVEIQENIEEINIYNNVNVNYKYFLILLMANKKYKLMKKYKLKKTT